MPPQWLKNLTTVQRASVEHCLANLRTFPWLRTRDKPGKRRMYGVWLDIGLGELQVYGSATRNWSLIPES